MIKRSDVRAEIKTARADQIHIDALIASDIEYTTNRILSRFFWATTGDWLRIQQWLKEFALDVERNIRKYE